MEDMKNNVHPDPSETWNDEQVERKEANGSNQDCQEGRQACKEKPEEEIQASCEQKEENREEREASERKAEDPQGQEKGAGDQGKGMEKESVRGTSGSTAYFLGDITRHPSYGAMHGFADRAGFSLRSLSSEPLRDLGGIFFLE